MRTDTTQHIDIYTRTELTEKQKIASKRLLEEVEGRKWMPVSGKQFQLAEDSGWEVLPVMENNTFGLNNGLIIFTDNSGNTFIGWGDGETQEESVQLLRDIGMEEDSQNPFSVAPSEVVFHDSVDKIHWEYINTLRKARDLGEKLLSTNRKVHLALSMEGES